MMLTEIKSKFYTELSTLYTPSEIDVLFTAFVQEYLGADKIYIRNFRSPLSSRHIQLLNSALSALKSGQPYQQILGKAYFFGLTFKVNEHTLIPRPETEELLEIAIREMKQRNLNNCKILDIGTGSGVIPIILKKHFPNAQISSMDISNEALSVAKENAHTHGTTIDFIHDDYLQYPLDEKYQVMISNPPYIGKDEEANIEHSVKKFEPNIALFSPTEDALVFYRKISSDAEKFLEKEGMVLLEINQKWGKETLALFKNFSQAELIKDLSGNDRIIMAKK